MTVDGLDVLQANSRDAGAAIIKGAQLTGLERAAISGTEPHIPFLASGSYPVRAGNLVRPLVDGEPAFRRICEAIDAARCSVWVTVAFITPTFEMPDGRGSLFDVLDRAAARGLDVRALFWRHNLETAWLGPRTFSGSPAQREMLRARGSRFRARWDRAHKDYCHHQKGWLMDAGQPSETAFIGGINLNPDSVVSPGHVGERHNHDAYVEVSGPSATDVHHNFVQRWNEASDRADDHGVWGHDGHDDLAFPTRPSSPRGESLVQIQRSVPAGRYSDGRPSPGGHAFAIAGGETSIVEQYLQAIDAARCSIYVENQALEAPEILAKLKGALERGVEVVALVPGEPEAPVRTARQQPERRAFLYRRAALGRYERFALIGIAGPGGSGGRHNVYVHAKIMVIDDAWATIGSCNLHERSLLGHTEMNATFWHPKVVRVLRCELLAEHLGQDTAHLDARAALGLYRQVAQENRLKRDAGDFKWRGLAFSLDPATYGE